MLQFRRRAGYFRHQSFSTSRSSHLAVSPSSFSTREVISSSSFDIEQDLSSFQQEHVIASCGFGVEQGTSDVSSSAQSRSSHAAVSPSSRVFGHHQFRNGADPRMLRFRRRAAYPDISSLSTRQVISSNSSGVEQGTSDVSSFSTEQILACCGFGVEQGTSDVSSFGTEQILACCGFGVAGYFGCQQFQHKAGHLI